MKALYIAVLIDTMKKQMLKNINDSKRVEVYVHNNNKHHLN